MPIQPVFVFQSVTPSGRKSTSTKFTSQQSPSHCSISICIPTLKTTTDNREKCDVTLRWQQNFWISTIFLDRDSHLHYRTMEEKYGIQFVPESNHAQGSHTCQKFVCLFVFFHICRTTVYGDHQKLCYYVNVT